MIRHDILGHNGVSLAVFEDGPQDAPQNAPAILLIHGWSQHHLSWERQSPLARDFRLIMPDLRGHGASGKPDGATAYDTSAPWAGDIAAIISALHLRQPVLVGWSMGGWVAQDYLRHHGDSGIAGLCLVGTSVRTGAELPAEVRRKRQADTAVQADGMFGTDQAAELQATVAFVRACFHRQPDPDALARMVGFNMLVPPGVRAAARNRTEDYREAAAHVTVPVLVAWGDRERLAVPPMGQQAADAYPTARTRVYTDCGHAPFYEDAEAFNADLAAFVRGCAGG